jgi:hypothetical protein
VPQPIGGSNSVAAQGFNSGQAHASCPIGAPGRLARKCWVGTTRRSHRSWRSTARSCGSHNCMSMNRKRRTRGRPGRPYSIRRPRTSRQGRMPVSSPTRIHPTRSGDCRTNSRHLRRQTQFAARKSAQTRDKKSPAAKQGLRIYANGVRWVRCPVAERTGSRPFGSCPSGPVARPIARTATRKFSEAPTIRSGRTE